MTGIDLAAANQAAAASAEGCVLRVGTVELEVTGETAPCDRMEEAWPGLRAALAVGGRGGVTCRVRRGGELAAGDPVRPEPARLAAGAAPARSGAGG